MAGQARLELQDRPEPVATLEWRDLRETSDCRELRETRGLLELRD